MIHFNAPLPELISLDFLLYRWGFHTLGKDANRALANNFEAYLRELLLFTLYVDNCNGEFAFIEEQPTFSRLRSSFFAFNDAKTGDLKWFSKEVLNEIGLEVSWEPYQLIEIVYLRLERNTVLENGFSKPCFVIDGIRIYNTFGFFIDSKTLNDALVYTRADWRFQAADIFIKRESLKAFEQISGFYNHELSKEELKPYMDKKNAYKDKDKYPEHLRIINDSRKLPSEKEQNTINEYIAAKTENPQHGKTALLTTTAERISEIEGKQITYRGVESRLKKAGFTDF